MDQNLDSQVDSVNGSVDEAAEAGVTIKEERNGSNVRERSESPAVKSPKFEGFRSPRAEPESAPESGQKPKEPGSTGDGATGQDKYNEAQSSKDPKQSSNE